MAPLDEIYDPWLVQAMVKNYGDLLKVSRTPGAGKPLPSLRKYVKENPYVRHAYLEVMQAEAEGQGLAGHTALQTYLAAQAELLADGASKNSTLYASEVKRIVTSGEQTAKSAVQSKTAQAHSEARVQEILFNPFEVEIDKVAESEWAEVREYLLCKQEGFARFTRWTFLLQMNMRFQEQDFHHTIFDTCQKVINGEPGHDRVIITIPPRHSKTQILSIALPNYAFVINAGSRSILTSYADSVVLDSSNAMREVIAKPIFSKVFPHVELHPNKKAGEEWGTTRAGILIAVSMAGKATGRGAGSLRPEFSGLLVVDDALKPKSAFSTADRDTCNTTFRNTMLSRLANDGIYQDDDGVDQTCARTPVVIIMQRLHQEDLVGFCFAGETPDRYKWLHIPAIIEKDTGTKAWYDKLITAKNYTHADPIPYTLPREEPRSALWPSRKSLESLDSMCAADPYTFHSQYMGDPTGLGTGLVDEEFWTEYDPEEPLPKFRWSFMIGDTASTAQTYSDPSFIAHWGVTKAGELWLLDCILGKWEVPELLQEIKDFWAKRSVLNRRRPTDCPRALFLEKKASGQYLVQTLQKKKKGKQGVKVQPVPRDSNAGDKVARFLNTLPYFVQKSILVPSDHVHTPYMRREILGMTGNGSGTGNDDVCDVFADAVAVAEGKITIDYRNWL